MGALRPSGAKRQNSALLISGSPPSHFFAREGNVCESPHRYDSDPRRRASGDLFSEVPTCLQQSGDCLADAIFGDWFCVQCATHFGCSPNGRKGGWTEGMADALGEMFYRAKINPSGADDLQICSPTGPDKENSIAAFVFAVAQRDPRAFMDTFRNATLTYTGQGTDHAKTVDIFHSFWRDENPSVGFIVDHHPGTWNVSALYNFLINGTTTAVELNENVPLGAPEFQTSPNPVSGSLSIDGRNCPAG